MCAPGTSSTCAPPASRLPQLTESRGDTLFAIQRSTQTISAVSKHTGSFSVLPHPGQLLGRAAAIAPKLRTGQLLCFSPIHLLLTLRAVCRHINKRHHLYSLPICKRLGKVSSFLECSLWVSSQPNFITNCPHQPPKRQKTSHFKYFSFNRHQEWTTDLFSHEFLYCKSPLYVTPLSAQLIPASIIHTLFILSLRPPQLWLSTLGERMCQATNKPAAAASLITA